MNRLRIVLFSNIPEEAKLRTGWNALARCVEHPQVFYTYEWALAVQRAYEATLSPTLFLGYDEQETLRGVAALALDKGRGWVSFLCATTGDYCDFLSSNEDRAAFVSGVFTELKKQGFDRITLTNLPAESATVAALRSASADCGYHFFARTAYECAQVALDALPRREGKMVPPRARKWRRAMNTISRDAPVRVEHVQSFEEAAPMLPQFAQMHIGRFLVTGRISNLARAERRRFLDELARLLGESGWLRLSVMAKGEKIIAWNYGFQFENTWFWYQPTFESELEKYSPGFCLLGKIIEDAVSTSRIKIVDFGLGAEEYKEALANQTRETLYVTLRGSRFEHGREVLRYCAARLVTSRPRVEKGIRRLIERVKEIRERVGQEGVFAASRRWLGNFLWSGTEVLFFEPIDVEPEGRRATLKRLDLNDLALAVEQYVDDRQTCAYLVRSATRLREPTSEGYGLVDENGHYVHFAWVTPFDRFFLSELNAKTEAPSNDCVMLFDCWTPASQRGRGYYGYTAASIAKMMRARGKNPWIFSAARNVSSVRGLEKAGFRKRYALVRKRRFGWQWVAGEVPKIDQKKIAEVPAQV